MPRPLRQIVSGGVYHVLNRANGRRHIFRKPADFQAFVDVLAEGLERYRVELLAWCVMSNHWHLVLRPRGEGQLQTFMQWISLTHVRRHHGHHGNRTGHLYQGRYKHLCVEEDAYFLTLCRYVEANPLRARLVKRAQDWPWSSLHQRQQRGTIPPLADWPVDRPTNWTNLVNQSLPESELKQVRESIARDRPLGTPDWVRRTARRLGLEQTLNARGRPRNPIDSLSPRQQRRRKKQEEGQNGT